MKIKRSLKPPLINPTLTKKYYSYAQIHAHKHDLSKHITPTRHFGHSHGRDRPSSRQTVPLGRLCWKKSRPLVSSTFTFLSLSLFGSFVLTTTTDTMSLVPFDVVSFLFSLLLPRFSLDPQRSRGPCRPTHICPIFYVERC